MLASRGRITLPHHWKDWLKRTSEQPGFKIQPATPDIAALSAALEMRRDPVDRLVVASSVALDLPLITADRKIQTLDFVPAVW